MSRSARSLMAQETLAIVAQGHYQSPSGRTIDIAEAVRNCEEGTRFHSVGEMNSIRRKSLARSVEGRATRFEVVNETTLSGIGRLWADGAGSVVALNFASARNPGGGFLNGAVAQEESLARSSALYASLLRAHEFYDQHRQSSALLYSDAMIVSPDCPIFRDDHGELLEEPQRATFLTSPAPNAGAITAKRSPEGDRVNDVLRRRAELILALAASLDVPNLVLGAWGCGVFRNDPQVVASAFADPLRSGVWSNRFDRVILSVLDNSSLHGTIQAFENAFG